MLSDSAFSRDRVVPQAIFAASLVASASGISSMTMVICHWLWDRRHFENKSQFSFRISNLNCSHQRTEMRDIFAEFVSAFSADHIHKLANSAWFSSKKDHPAWPHWKGQQVEGIHKSRCD
jgi:hypothetical protein